jgi:hypothetical protein
MNPETEMVDVMIHLRLPLAFCERMSHEATNRSVEFSEMVVLALEALTGIRREQEPLSYLGGKRQTAA